MGTWEGSQVPEAGLLDRVLGCLLGGEIGDAMGAPAEGKTYQQIEEEYGELRDFSGCGTDDSALKYILCDAIIRSGGCPTADGWAQEWLAQEDLFLTHHLFWTPVMNVFWKVRGEGVAPREAGRGTMASSSSAMGISPIGIINAGDPVRAALEAYEVASLIHHNYCRDAAAAMAAATAAAFDPRASVGSILEAAVAVLPPVSARVMRTSIQSTLALAEEAGDYRAFRARFYSERLLEGAAMADARETVPVALALFRLAGGDPQMAIIYGANFGRDADTIASMAGALAGAWRGRAAFPTAWVEQMRAQSPRRHDEIARALLRILLQRAEEAEARAGWLRDGGVFAPPVGGEAP
jgi:ADP-ribosylglycohydrolase